MSSTTPLRSTGATDGIAGRRFQVFTARNLERIPGVSRLSAEQRFAMEVVASVLPFRVNEYVVNELIDWGRVPDDPIFQLVFPQRDMLAPESFARMAEAIRSGADRSAI